jgi:sugar phosphate isomerase/epimerase
MTNNPKLGLCWGMFIEMSAKDFISLVGRHGFQSIQFGPAQFRGARAPARGEARRMLDDNGIIIASFDGVMAGLPRLPPEARQYVLSEDEYFRLAEDANVSCFNVPHWCGDPKTPLNEFVDMLGPFSERAAKRDIAIGLEFLPGTGIPDLPSANRISEAIGLSNIGITVDTWHLARSRGSNADIRRLPPGRVKAFQVSDRALDEDKKPDEEMWGRLIPGEGALPLQETIDLVMANNPGIGIDGEIFSKELVERPDDETASRVAQALRQYF